MAMVAARSSLRPCWRRIPRRDYVRTMSNAASSEPNATSSIESAEVEKFSRLSSTWWDYTQNPLMAMNPARISYIVKTLASHPTTPEPLLDLRILDIGCGGGLLAESLARLGAEVTAIDPSTEVVQVARRRSRLDPRLRHRIRYRAGIAVEDLPRDRRFDAVCMMDVVEHVEHPEGVIAAASHLLKESSETAPSGTLFLSTLNKTYKSYLVAILGAEYFLQMLPVGTHDWNKFLSPRDVQRMLPPGMRALNASGMLPHFCPFSGLHWVLHPTDVQVNWIGAYRFSDDLS